MSTKSEGRQKMCPNCDGRIPLDASQCPYCFSAQPAETVSSSLYTPPYQAKTQTGSEPRRKTTTAQAAVLPEESAKSAGAESIWPIFFLSLAGNLSTLGLLQFFFSEGGVVRLEMNSGYWLLFLLASAPLFYFGFKWLEKE